MTRKLLFALPAVAAVVATSLPASAQVYYGTPVADPLYTYVDSYGPTYYTDYGYNRGSRVLTNTIGGAAIGAGVGALGGLAVGALNNNRNDYWGPYGYYGHRRSSLGRSAGVGAAIGAGVGGGLGLLKGLLDNRQVASPGYYWY